MRSQASKPLPKKGDLSKIPFKSSSVKQAAKKSVSPKKVKTLVKKSLIKNPKKSTSKDESSSSNSDDNSGTSDKQDTSTESNKPSPCKASTSRGDSPTKKLKKDPKEKKDTLKSTSDIVKKAPPKKSAKTVKKPKAAKTNVKKCVKGKKDVKYKINKDVIKKTAPKFSKAKTVIKKGNAANNDKKKGAAQPKPETTEKEQNNDESLNCADESINIKSNAPDEKNDESDKTKINDENVDGKIDSQSNSDSSSCNTPPKASSASQPETPKSETERPPKFFTSTRSPRMVDIDVKCCKNSKGNLSVSERFVSMKLENKVEDNAKDKNSSNTLVSQGPEIDVYTFTEKVDSPKSILSDFRSPVNKNVGRVRPIARVKGTVIDKKTESEKKKYSPHRPIEEVVKQLKNKRSEELNANQNQSVCTATSAETNPASNETETEEKPKPIVSKSYKMVARKSSITGKPFSPIKFLEQETVASKTEKSEKSVKPNPTAKKAPTKTKKQAKKPSSLSDEDIDNSKFALNTKAFHYSSSEESESNDDNDTKESSESDNPKNKKTKNKKFKKNRITDGAKKPPSKELKELSKDSLIDLKESSALLGNEKPSKRRLKLLSMWSGPKKHRMASLNALAKVHCLYENESKTHMELGLMKTVDRPVLPSTSKTVSPKKKEAKPKETEKQESTSESEYEAKKEKKEDSSESSDDNPPQRSLRGVPGIRSAGKYWDPKSSTSSSEDSEQDTKKKVTNSEKKKASPKASTSKSDSDKPPAKMKKTAGVPVKKKRNRNEVVMDLKDMVVQKRMASLNATAILAASYEKRSPKSNKDDTTSDSCSDESYSQKSKNGVSSGVKSESKNEYEAPSESDESAVSDRKQKVEVIVNQDTDVTITGVYSTHHHEGFCTVSGMQYRISSTSHTQTTATANCEKEGCSREDGARYTPLSALSSMQPPAEHNHPHPVPELGGLARRPGCSSAFSAPSTASHHEQGYYQPAGPLIKESSADAERALARYHPHYHAPHPPVLQQYGPPYYPDLCYGRYYRPPGSYHMPPPQPDAQMVGVGNEPYPPPQYYGSPPCYQHSPQRIPYVEYRGCPCPLNACPKNVLIGPATGKAPAGGGPADVPPALAPPGAAFRQKVRACAIEAAADTHGSGKDPPLEPEPPAAADAPHPCAMPAMGGVSPKREIYDVRDKLRIANDIPGPAEALGPPSPARGSAGACAPQPPPVAPRRARLGKAMARRSLAGDDTGLLLSTPQPPLLAHHSDADDDVLAISPPTCAPIDLSSSDERSTPLVDVKKENEGPTYNAARKPDAQALREHNSTTITEASVVTDAAKAVKRRYSKPKLEIDMKDTQLEEACKTNGIGEHVKLVKRRKVSGDQTDIQRTETVTKEPKKKQMQPKRTPKSPTAEKKSAKRKSECGASGPKPKKMLLDKPAEEDARLKSVALVADEPLPTKPKNKSALLLDNLIRKNSIDRPDAKGLDAELNPAELFLSPNENIAQNSAKKTLNINNNIVENANTPNGVRANTLAAVSQLIGKKMACKVEKVDSKVTHGVKSVLKTPTVKSGPEEDRKPLSKSDGIDDKSRACAKTETEVILPQVERDVPEIVKDNKNCVNIISSDVDITIPAEITIASKVKEDFEQDVEEMAIEAEIKEKLEEVEEKKIEDVEKEKPKPVKLDRTTVKRCKLSNGEMKAKNVEKVVKLLVSKRPAIKTDDATLVVEEACASPVPTSGAFRRARRRGGHSRRGRRPLAPPALPAYEPHAPPRWSNGWKWDGEHYLSKVYLNNDSRLDRTARCWSRMTHASGDSVSRGDCVLLRASLARAQPYVARVASLWENPDDGEMMVSLVWYYRPEHTDLGRQPADAPDEVFASRHRDANSVACIEDKCYVLTFNEYCRYRKRLKAAEEGMSPLSPIVPGLPAGELQAPGAPSDARLPAAVSPELVLFCRKIYDFRSKKIHVPNK